MEMKDRNGKTLKVGDRVRWGSGLNLCRGIVREIRESCYKPGVLECMADDGSPGNPDVRTNGWTALGCLTSREVTKLADAMSPEAMERLERAELARLLAKYGGAK